MSSSVNIKLFRKQIQAYQLLEDSITNEVCYGGAARGGKSWLGCTWQVIRRIKFPGSAGMIAREELSKLKDTTLLTFFQVLTKLGIRNTVHFNAQALVATFPNGSRIFFREIKYLPSDPEFDRLGSFDLTDIFIDEAQQIHSKAINVLKGRLSLLYGEGWSTIPKSLYTCNPSKNWVYSEFVRPERDGTLRADRAFIKALPVDNPHVPQSYKDNLLKADKVTVQRLYYGNFEYDDDPTVLCDFDAICDAFTNDFVLPDGNKAISADLAMQGRDKLIVGVWDGLTVKVAIEQAVSSGKSIERDLANLMITERVPRSKTVVDSSGMGEYLESYLNGIKPFHGNERANKAIEFANIKTECAYKLAELINKRQLKIICTDKQRELIAQELGELRADSITNDDGKKRIVKKDVMKERLSRSPDYLDMLIMGMYFHVQPDTIWMI